LSRRVARGPFCKLNIHFCQRAKSLPTGHFSAIVYPRLLRKSCAPKGGLICARLARNERPAEKPDTPQGFFRHFSAKLNTLQPAPNLYPRMHALPPPQLEPLAQTVRLSCIYSAPRGHFVPRGSPLSCKQLSGLPLGWPKGLLPAWRRLNLAAHRAGTSGSSWSKSVAFWRLAAGPK